MYRRSRLGPWPTDATPPGDGSWAARRAVLIERIAAREKRIAREQGLQAGDMAELMRGASIEAGADETDYDHERRSVRTELALKLQTSEETCTARIEDAEGIASRLPKTLLAVQAGAITWVKARIILDETMNLTVEQCLQAEDGVLRRAANLTPGNLRRAAKKIVTRIDKDAAKKRATAERRERDVKLGTPRDGMCTLEAYLPVEEAIAAYGVIDTLATANKNTREPGDDRGKGELRADGFIDLLTRPDGQERVRYDIRVIVTAGTLLGLDDNDAYIPGHGPIPAELARELAADNTWRRILTDPNTGHLLDLGADRYKPSERLKEFIRTRDQHCRFPGCRRKAEHCDIDHSIEFPIGGRTIRINCGCLCENTTSSSTYPDGTSSRTPTAPGP